MLLKSLEMIRINLKNWKLFENWITCFSFSPTETLKTCHLNAFLNSHQIERTLFRGFYKLLEVTSYKLNDRHSELLVTVYKSVSYHISSKVLYNLGFAWLIN